MEQQLDIPVFVERNYFAGSRFDDVIEWIKQRSDREIHAQVSGTHKLTKKEIDVEGRVLDTRHGGLRGRRRLAILVRNVHKGSQDLKDTIVTVGSDKTEREEIAAKQFILNQKISAFNFWFNSYA